MDINQSHFPNRVLSYSNPLTKQHIKSHHEILVAWLEGLKTKEIFIPNLFIRHTPLKYNEAISVAGYLLKYIYKHNLIKENAFYYLIPSLLAQIYKIPDNDEWKMKESELIIFDQIGVAMREHETRWALSVCLPRLHDSKPTIYIGNPANVPDILQTFLSQSNTIEIQ